MLSDIIKTYNPPKELISSIESYHFIVLSDAPPKQFETLDSAIEEFNSGGLKTIRLLLELVDNTTGVPHSLELYSDINHLPSIKTITGWRIYAPLSIRTALANHVRINIFSGEITLDAYIKYYTDFKLKKFINKI